MDMSTQQKVEKVSDAMIDMAGNSFFETKNMHLQKERMRKLIYNAKNEYDKTRIITAIFFTNESVGMAFADLLLDLYYGKLRMSELDKYFRNRYSNELRVFRSKLDDFAKIQDDNEKRLMIASLRTKVDYLIQRLDNM